ncbi:methylmalonyl-CoA mutase family protein [Pseudomonas sp. A014]
MNNVMHTTVKTLAAVFAGTQSLHANAWGEAMASPSPGSAGHT